ncbi:MAG TPA: IS3 family transposase [Candidatus Paceibacterota bacterium]|jgi:putative transposase|nr:IS3 family transposase [Dehalococcoidia bacterium]HRT09813.1 IS3 family transposase [Candidatus Paceibacterota bacterium]
MEASAGEVFGVTVSAVCRRLGMSRQNYYAQRRRRQRQAVDADLIEQLVVAERRLQPRLGGRKLYKMLQPELRAAGVKIGRDRFFEVLAQRDLLLEPQPAEYPCTTQSRHNLPVFTNRIKGLQLTGANQVWVSDITYLRTAEGFVYLALITDKYSRKIVGHHGGDTLETEGCLQALEVALAILPAGARPIHHSDCGSQYCSHRYVNRLAELHLGVSMTETDHCAENALAERVNGILKQEYGLGATFQTKADALRAAAQAIRLYNTRRPHSALKYQVPDQVHQFGLN